MGLLVDCQYYVKTLVGNGVASSTGDSGPPSSATVNALVQFGLIAMEIFTLVKLPDTEFE